LIVRYEDLLADTTKGLRSIYSWLGLAPPQDLFERVEKRAFSAAANTAKGPGKFQRAATPGLWRENLTSGEQHLCEKIMGSMLRTMGYELSTPPTNDRREARFE
jgi:hypothetical protein